MATITTRSIIDDLIKNNGHCEDDPQAYAIFEYETPEGGLAWSVCWLPMEVDALLASPYCRNIQPLWWRHGGLTPVGRDFLDGGD